MVIVERLQRLRSRLDQENFVRESVSFEQRENQCGIVLLHVDRDRRRVFANLAGLTIGVTRQNSWNQTAFIQTALVQERLHFVWLR